MERFAFAKANGNVWIKADYNVPLEKGDVVQPALKAWRKLFSMTARTIRQAGFSDRD